MVVSERLDHLCKLFWCEPVYHIVKVKYQCLATDGSAHVSQLIARQVRPRILCTISYPVVLTRSFSTLL